jgi:hypothetical protein
MNQLSLPRHHPEEVKNGVGWDGEVIEVPVLALAAIATA